MKIPKVIFLTLFFPFLSCQVPITVQPVLSASKSNEPSITLSLAAMVSSYTDKIVTVYNTFGVSPGTARAIVSPIDIVAYFDSLAVTNGAGNPIKVSRLPGSERDAFLAFWKKQTAINMTNNLEGMQDSIDTLSDINDSLEMALSETNKVHGDYVQFCALYSSQFEKKQSAREAAAASPRSARSMGTPTTGATDDVIYWEGFYKLKATYQQGYIIATDTNGDSPFGHASMFAENAWRPEWNEPNGGPTAAPWQVDYSARISISSYLTDPNSTPSYFDVNGNLADVSLSNLTEYGVSFETMHWWITHGNWIKHVKVFQPGYTEWIWDGLNSGDRWFPADANARAQAVANAKSNFGKPYSKDWGNRDRTDQFYCSQIVWRSWYDVSSKYNYCPPYLPPGTGIAPNFLMQSDNLRTVAEWNMDDPMAYVSFTVDINGDSVPDGIRITPPGHASTGLEEISIGNTGNWVLEPRGNAFSKALGQADTWIAGTSSSSVPRSLGTQVVDINGDAKADLVQMYLPGNGDYGNSPRRRVFLSDGSKFVYDPGYTTSLNTADTWFTGTNSNGTNRDMGTRLVDVDGDGKVDLVQMYIPGNGDYGNAPQRKVSLNTGSGFVSSASYTSSLIAADTWVSGSMEGGYSRDLGTQIVDINGDTKADLVQMYLPGNGDYGNSPRRRVFLSDGSKFVYDPGYTTSLNTADTWFTGTNSNGTNRDMGTRLVDVDGDGKVDLVQAYYPGNGDYGNASQRKTYLNTGIGFTQSINYTRSLDASDVYISGSDTGGSSHDLGTLIVDVDGDGKADLVQSYSPSNGEYNNTPKKRVFINLGELW